jgi:hypothetical protein
MSINLIRSPRKTEFWRVTTPNTVGPGSYLTKDENMIIEEN